MTDSSKPARRKAAPQPLDHLRPGEADESALDTKDPNVDSRGSVQPQEAAAGKLTRGPAPTATRPHLEGSEQGPA